MLRQGESDALKAPCGMPRIFGWILSSFAQFLIHPYTYSLGIMPVL